MKRRTLFCMIICLLLLSTAGCSKERVALEPVTIAPYERITYETTPVLQGDVTPRVMLQLAPVDKRTLKYYPPEDWMEVDEIYVKSGDFVEEGDVLVRFKSGDVEDKIQEYRDELAMQELLIEHYEQLMIADIELDYTEDIEQLKKDMEITKLYIAEESAKLEKYTIRSETRGMVDTVSQLMLYSKVTKTDCVVSVLYNNGEYRTTIQDNYLYEVGTVYTAKSSTTTYEMELIAIEEVSGNARSLVFRALDMNGIMRLNFINLTIEMSTLSGALYVDKDAVIEVNDKNYVFMLSEDGFKQGIEVEVDSQVEDYIIIKSGVKAGDRVVLN